MAKRRFEISVTYDGGVDKKMDKKIEAAIGCPAHSSGQELFEPFPRDLAFTLKSTSAVEAAKAKLHLIGNIRVSIYLWEMTPDTRSH